MLNLRPTYRWTRTCILVALIAGCAGPPTDSSLRAERLRQQRETYLHSLYFAAGIEGEQGPTTQHIRALLLEEQIPFFMYFSTAKKQVYNTVFVSESDLDGARQVLRKAAERFHDHCFSIGESRIPFKSFYGDEPELLRSITRCFADTDPRVDPLPHVNERM